jgi:hypothetical protein
MKQVLSAAVLFLGLLASYAAATVTVHEGGPLPECFIRACACGGCGGR